MQKLSNRLLCMQSTRRSVCFCFVCLQTKIIFKSMCMSWSLDNRSFIHISWVCFDGRNLMHISYLFTCKKNVDHLTCIQEKKIIFRTVLDFSLFCFTDGCFDVIAFHHEYHRRSYLDCHGLFYPRRWCVLDECSYFQEVSSYFLLFNFGCLWITSQFSLHKVRSIWGSIFHSSSREALLHQAPSIYFSSRWAASATGGPSYCYSVWTTNASANPNPSCQAHQCLPLRHPSFKSLQRAPSVGAIHWGWWEL